MSLGLVGLVCHFFGEETLKARGTLIAPQPASHYIQVYVCSRGVFKERLAFLFLQGCEV